MFGCNRTVPATPFPAMAPQAGDFLPRRRAWYDIVVDLNFFSSVADPGKASVGVPQLRLVHPHAAARARLSLLTGPSGPASDPDLADA